MISLFEPEQRPARIKVIGVGGCGGTAVKVLMNSGLMSNVEFIAANTDMQALGNNPAPTKIQLGKDVTRGLGAGNNPEVGRQAAEEAREQISDCLTGADMIFIVAGMGGGTGTGASPIVAEEAKKLGALVVGVVTTPFSYEGPVRKRYAESGVTNLTEFTDNIILIPNQRVLETMDKKTTVSQGHQMGISVLQKAVYTICHIICSIGEPNIDFGDVKATLTQQGQVLFGSAVAHGEGGGEQALNDALHNQLIDEFPIADANKVLVNITTGIDAPMWEFSNVMNMVRSLVDQNESNIKEGHVIDPDLGDGIMVEIIATGCHLNNLMPAERDLPVSNTIRRIKFEKPVTVNEDTSPLEMKTDADENAAVIRNIRQLEFPSVSDDDMSTPAYLRRRKTC